MLQGPVITTHDYTLETIKIYKKIFPKSHIILSTWQDENTEYLKKINSDDCIIIQNKKPDFSGSSNINLQIASSNAGIK